MSNDLISRKAVMDYLREQQATVIIEKNKNNSVSNYYIPGIQESIQTFMNFIVQVTAAYDVDKVVEKIKDRVNDAEKVIVKEPHDKLDEIANDTAESFIAAYNDCIDIVKAGEL